MKRNRKKKERPVRVIKLWTYPQANKALPYLRSVAGSLREHWLEAQNKRNEVKRLDDRKGRPDFARLVARQNADTGKSEAEDRFSEALNELMGIDVYLLDPVQGVAFIPFKKGDNLAWFVFDLFDNEGLKTWRFHEDPIEMRRPIAEVLEDASANPVNPGPAQVEQKGA